jgi:pyrroline-5-carboxylate reductase
MSGPVLLVGCGNMGAALLAGWRGQGYDPNSITVVEPDDDRAAAARQLGVRVLPVAEAARPGDHPTTVVLAVKPQLVEQVLPTYHRHAVEGCLVLSIAAGRTLASLEHAIGTPTAMVRAMPNTPAAVRRGITVACRNPRVTEAQRETADRLLASVGEVAWIDDESWMDAVTAVSGSGPAYVFLLAECLTKAAIEAGLPPALAERLARATVTGAGEMLGRSPETAATLRQRVTSPGGTTAAAIEVLTREDAWGSILSAAVAAATRRSRSLAG